MFLFNSFHCLMHRNVLEAVFAVMEGFDGSIVLDESHVNRLIYWH